MARDKDGLTRKLVAILVADVVGYSRLSEADESDTITRLKSTRTELIDPELERHGGRLVKTTGDGLLVEFSSIVDAVQCAADLQEGLAERGAEVPPERRLVFRIGINLSDVIVDGDDILGDGVNVAARLEGLARPGGICLSGDAYRQVDGKLDLEFEDLGEAKLKNIKKPVRVYSVRKRHGAPLPMTDRSAPALPDKPSIAVLAFENMSDDPEQEYFADGIAEDIITALSRFHWFFVIARNSSFTYKGKAVDIKQVARELGVQYVLEGSVRKAGARARISAQLIDALSGAHLWAERFDRDLADIFAVQDEISEKVVAAVAPEFLSAEMQRAQRKDTRSLDVWDLVMRAHWHVSRFTKADNAEALGILKKAVALDKGNAGAMSDLAFTHIVDARFGWSESRERSLAEAGRVARRATELDDRDAWAFATLGYVELYSNRHVEALRALEQAVELNPNLSAACGNYGLALEFTGQAEAAIAQFDKAIRLSPRDPFLVLWLSGLGMAAFVAGRYEDAIGWAHEVVKERPEYPVGYRLLAAGYGQLDRLPEAREANAELLRLVPGLTLEAVEQQMPFQRPEDMARYLEGLRRAGLPGD